MPCRRPLFNRATRWLCLLAANGTPFGEAKAQACPAPHAGRLAVIGGVYAGAEVAAIAVRGHDWWTTPGRGFYLTWDRSPSAGQDRLLHATLGYHMSQAGALAFRWACLRPVPAAWLGAALGVAVAIPKEIGDGLHQSKGFSGPDMLWTALGSVLPALHQTWPRSRGVTVKVSYWPSQEYLNRTGPEPQLESDYAGQVYHLAVAPSELGLYRGWPRWLGVAVGHSVPYWASQPPVHEWYFTLDLRARGLPIRARWWRQVAWVLDQVHLPLPGLRLRDGNSRLGFF
jgi:hypothetical protein